MIIVIQLNTQTPSHLFVHVMRREKLKHFVTIGIIEGKRRGGKREKILEGLTKWLNVGRRTNAWKAVRDREAL